MTTVKVALRNGKKVEMTQEEILALYFDGVDAGECKDLPAVDWEELTILAAEELGVEIL